ncbi:MAG: CYTH domain-containing protein [Acidiferrobacterales bacterium]
MPRNANKGPAADRQPRETEVTLSAVGLGAAGVLSRIARLRRVGDYTLAPRPAQRIRDHYLDTPARALAAKRLALRIRDIGHQQWLTLKGPAHVTAYHAIERLEIDTPWSAAALQALVDELASFGVRLGGARPARCGDGALEVAASLGLAPIHQQLTHRRVRHIDLHQKDAHGGVAELALDTVLYRLDGAQYRHYEVEIEAKGKHSAQALPVIAQAMMARYPAELRIWYRSTLATARALRTLQASGDYVALHDRDAGMHVRAYEQIERFLRGSARAGSG